MGRYDSLRSKVDGLFRKKDSEGILVALEDKEEKGKEIAKLWLEKFRTRALDKFIRIHFVLQDRKKASKRVSSSSRKVEDVEFQEIIINVEKENLKQCGLFTKKTCDMLINATKKNTN